MSSPTTNRSLLNGTARSSSKTKMSRRPNNGNSNNANSDRGNQHTDSTSLTSSVTDEYEVVDEMSSPTAKSPPDHPDIVPTLPEVEATTTTNKMTTCSSPAAETNVDDDDDNDSRAVIETTKATTELSLDSNSKADHTILSPSSGAPASSHVHPPPPQDQQKQDPLLANNHHNHHHHLYHNHHHHNSVRLNASPARNRTTSSSSNSSSAASAPSLEVSVPMYYAGKHVLITGATGFIGKVLLEKLLRSCPDVAVLYCVIRPKKQQTVEERLAEIASSKVGEELVVYI